MRVSCRLNTHPIKSMKLKILTTVLAALCLPGVAGAAAINVNNASFEDNALTGNDWADGIPVSWTSQGDVDGTADPMTVDAANNSYFLELSGAIGSSGGDGLNYLGLRTGGFVYQDLGVVFQPNTTYTVDILASRRGGANTVGWFGIADNTASLQGTPGATDTSVFTTADTFQAVSSLTAAEGNVATFTTGATVPAGNVFLAVGATAGNVVYDLVSVDASAIPEPSSMALMLLGGLGLLRRRR
ncbi:MAG: hypothetical protein ACI8UZ_000554 [Akkermansiaceae bacterium]